MEKPYWTTLEVALALKAPLSTITNQIAAGQIRAHLQRGKVLVADVEVQRLIQEATNGGRAGPRTSSGGSAGGQTSSG